MQACDTVLKLMAAYFKEIFIAFQSFLLSLSKPFQFGKILKSWPFQMMESYS